MATASPAKFPEAVEKAIPMKENSAKLQQADPTASKVKHLFQMSPKFNNEMKSGADWTKILRAKIEEISNNITTS